MSDAARLRSNLWKLKAVRTLFWMHFFAAVLVPFFTEGAGLSLAQVLFLNSWFMAWNFLLEVPTGTVADRFGRKWSLALGALVAAIGTLFYASGSDFITFLVGEVMFAAAYTLQSGADEALAYDSLKALGAEDRAKSLFAQMESFKLGGIIAGTLFGGWIAAQFGLSAPLVAYAVPALTCCVLVLTLYEPPASSQEGDRPEAKLGYFTLMKEGIRFFKGHRVLMLLTAEICITNAVAWAIVWLFQPLLSRAGVDIRLFGLVHALACVGQILLLNFHLYLEEWFGSKRLVLLFCSFMTGLAFIDLAFVDSKILVGLAIVVAFSFSLPRVALFSAYMNRYIPSDKRATVLSVSSMLRTFSIVISNLIVGPLADWNLRYTMLILGVVIIGLTLFSRLEEKHLA